MPTALDDNLTVLSAPDLMRRFIVDRETSIREQTVLIRKTCAGNAIKYNPMYRLIPLFDAL